MIRCHDQGNLEKKKKLIGGLRVSGCKSVAIMVESMEWPQRDDVLRHSHEAEAN